LNNQHDDQAVEAQIQAKGLLAPRVTPAQIDALMERVNYVTVQRPGDTTSTYVHAFLDGRFALGTGFSACVDPANFNADIGSEIATKKAMSAARDKLWELEGYRLYASQKENQA
jgi:hypothetical protein